MRNVPGLVLAVMALAGCSSDGGPGNEVVQPPVPQGPETGGNATPSPPLPGPPIALLWEDELVAGVWACENTVTQACQWQPDGAFGRSHFFEVPAGNVTGALVLEWEAATALTAELVLEATVLTPDCPDCNRTYVGASAGPPPRSLALDGLRFGEGDAFHVAVYSNQYTAVDQGAAGTSGDQAFRVSGNVTVG